MPSRWDNGSLPHGGDDITQRGYAIGSHLTVAAMIAEFPHVTAYIAKGGRVSLPPSRIRAGGWRFTTPSQATHPLTISTNRSQ